MIERWLYSVLEKKKKSKKLSWTGSAAQSRKAKGDLLLGGPARTARGGSVKREKMEREEKQSTYFPVYPNLRDAERLRAGAGGKQRETERGKVGEETRASYCDSSAGKQGNEMVRKQLALRTCGESFKSKK